MNDTHELQKAKNKQKKKEINKHPWVGQLLQIKTSHCHLTTSRRINKIKIFILLTHQIYKYMYMYVMYGNIKLKRLNEIKIKKT